MIHLIYAKIELQGKKTTLSTGKFINKERCKSTNKLKNTLRLNTEKISKSTIDLLETKIESIYLELSKSAPNTTLADVKKKLNGKAIGKSEIDVLKLFQKHNDYFKRKCEAGEKAKHLYKNS